MNSLVRAEVRLCTATGTPRRAMLRARLAPMTASPVTPMRLSSVTGRTLLRDRSAPRRADRSPGLQLRCRRDDLPAQHLQAREVGDLRHEAVDLGDAELGEALDRGEQLVDLLPVRAGI